MGIIKLINRIVIGSGTISTVANGEELLEFHNQYLNDFIFHYFIDSDFFFNCLTVEERSVYLNHIKSKYNSNIIGNQLVCVNNTYVANEEYNFDEIKINNINELPSSISHKYKTL